MSPLAHLGLPTRRPSVPPAAQRIAARLAVGLRADAIYLFGSQARGDATADSDFDFLVVVPDSPLTRYARNVEARRIVGDIHVPKDIVVVTRREWEADLEVPCSLASTVRREGIPLHG